MRNSLKGKQAEEIKVLDDLNMKVDGIIITVAHDEFKGITLDNLKEMMNNNPILIDVRNMFDQKRRRRRDFCIGDCDTRSVIPAVS